MTKRGTSKPCLPCQKAKLTPAEKLQKMVETHSTVCFQSLDEFQGYSFVGLFNGMVRGTNRLMRRMEEIGEWQLN